MDINNELNETPSSVDNATTAEQVSDNKISGPAKLVIAIVILIATINAFSSLILAEDCHGGIGCIGLIPFVVAAFPTLPIVNLFKFIFIPSDVWYHSFFRIKSLIIYLLPVAISIYVYLITYFILRFSFRKTWQDKRTKIKKVVIISSGIYLLISFGLMLSQSIPVPFEKKYKVIASCSNFDNKKSCFDSAYSYIVPDCQGNTNFFMYPFIINQNNNSCFLENFIKVKPFAENSVANFEAIVPYFDSYLKNASEKQKKEFCQSFSKNPTYYTPNQDSCFSIVGVVSDDTSYDTCKQAVLTVNYKQDNEMLNLCIDKYAGYKVSDIEDSVLESIFAKETSSTEFSSEGVFRYIKVIGGGEDLVYKNRIRSSDNFVSMNIRESAVGGNYYKFFYPTARKYHFLNEDGETECTEERKDLMKKGAIDCYDDGYKINKTESININGVQVHIDYMDLYRIGMKYKFEKESFETFEYSLDREVVMIHLIKDKTYVQVFSEDNGTSIFYDKKNIEKMVNSIIK